MACTNPILESITIDDFKEFFSRDFPYLPIWSISELYNTNDEVYYETNKLFYKSLIDGNTGLIPPDNTDEWEKYTDSIDNYVLDSDIEKAFNQACCSINTSLYTSDECLTEAYLYLTAHYLVQDLQMALQGVQSTGNFNVNSRTVGSVSESYVIPDSYSKSPILSYYTKTGYGLKYLNLTIPATVGNINAVSGASTP